MTASLHILRVGLAITFLWVGILIFKNPVAWGQMVQPWALALLPVSLKSAMLMNAVLDVLVGIFLLIDVQVLWASLLGALHLLIVLIVVGINGITTRDIGLLAGALALFVNAMPEAWIQKFKLNNGTQK
ncbi:MAG TPA: hypothetical protein VIH31_02425 [Candidatus Paceibacterota bacterium]